MDFLNESTALWNSSCDTRRTHCYALTVRRTFVQDCRYNLIDTNDLT